MLIRETGAALFATLKQIRVFALGQRHIAVGSPFAEITTEMRVRTPDELERADKVSADSAEARAASQRHGQVEFVTQHLQDVLDPASPPTASPQRTGRPTNTARAP